MTERRVVCFKCGMVTSRVHGDLAVDMAQFHADATGHETDITAGKTFLPRGDKRGEE